MPLTDITTFPYFSVLEIVYFQRDGISLIGKHLKILSESVVGKIEEQTHRILPRESSIQWISRDKLGVA